MTVLVGVLSDTHGRLDSAIVDLFAGCDHIIHAGDIDDPAILERLAAIAPVTAVYGNCDGGSFLALNEAETVTLEGVAVRVRHSIAMVEALDGAILDAMRQARVGVVIGGHTHVSLVDRRDGILFLNPGSATLRKQGVQRSVAVLRITGEHCDAEILDLGWDVPI